MYEPLRDPRYTNPPRPLRPGLMHRLFEPPPRRFWFQFWRKPAK
jgi:hypothetical protein